MFRRIGLTALFLLFCVNFNAFADTESDTYTLGEVVVTAPKAEGVETIATFHQVTAKEIQMRGATTLDKALELLPGLDIHHGGAGTPRVDIRGMRPRHVILLLNGIPFNSTYDGQFDPSTISTENIAKIKVSYGNASVLYGQGGLGGVINIITKKGTKGIKGGIDGRIDDRGNYTTLIDASGGNENVDFFVSGSRQDSDGFKLSRDFNDTAAEDGGIRENSDAERNNFYANLGFKANEALRFGLVAGGTQGEYGIPHEVENAKKWQRIDDYDSQFGQISMGYDPGGIFDVRAWGYVNKSKSELDQYTDDSYETINAEQDDETEIYGGTILSTLTTEKYGKLSFSINGEKDSYEADGYTKKADIDIDHDIQLFAVAAEYEIILFDRLDVVAGYSHHWQNKDEGQDDDRGSWLFGLSYDLFENTRLRTSYARKIRFASISNLYDDSAGNEDLKTESSDNFEFGVTQRLPWDIMADLAVFRDEVEDYIEKDDATDIYENNDEYRFKGVELTLSKSFARAGVSLGYSWMDAVDKSDGSAEDDLHYRPRHKITLQGNYAFDFGLTTYASLREVMGQVYYDGDDKEDLGDYLIVDIRLEQRVYKNNCFVYVGAENLFDEDYEENYGYPQAGRTLYAGMRVRF